jgi:hypothetical protein
MAHRVSWEIANGKKVPEGKNVLHKCGNPACVNPSHLYIGTQKENVRDAINAGTHCNPVYKGFGESHSQAKLTEKDVREIRGLHRAGIGYRKIADRFNVDYTNIRRIIKKETWGHLA